MANHRTLKIRTKCNLAASEVGHSIAPPDAPIGERGMVRVIEITDIPDGVSVHEVIRAWSMTADCTAYGTPDLRYPGHSYKFADIGAGKILRGKEARNA